MIIIEGMDNTGKSTLVTRLSKDLKLVLVNNQKRPAHAQEALTYIQGVLTLARDFRVIADRWAPISEPIYGPICRNTHLFTNQDLQQQLGMTLQVNPLIIYCRPPTPRVLDFGNQAQMDGVIDNADKLLGSYDAFMGNLVGMGFTVVNYDWTIDDYTDILKVCHDHHLKEPS